VSLYPPKLGDYKTLLPTRDSLRQVPFFLILLTVRLSELTQKFEGVTVDILNPGDEIALPPAYIHAVITPLMSSLINISFFRSDWIETAKTGLRRERAFCEGASTENLKLIIGRRERDLGMYKILHEKELEHNLVLQKLIEEEAIMIQEIRALQGKSKRKADGSTQVAEKRRSERRKGNR